MTTSSVLQSLATASSASTVPAGLYGQLIALAASSAGPQRKMYEDAAAALWAAKVEAASGNVLGARAQITQAFVLAADAAFVVGGV